LLRAIKPQIPERCSHELLFINSDLSSEQSNPQRKQVIEDPGPLRNSTKSHRQSVPPPAAGDLEKKKFLKKKPQENHFICILFDGP
jgi:hypothetical protein